MERERALETDEEDRYYVCAASKPAPAGRHEEEEREPLLWEEYLGRLA